MQNDLESQNIGTDPSVVSVIETLDIEPPEEKPEKKKRNKKSTTPNPDRDPHGLIKKVLFVIIILALMCGVGYGVYYYLSLGTGRKVTKTSFTLENQLLYIGEELSTNILDYGDFKKTDISKCTLDTSAVNVKEEGEYVFMVKCGTTEKSAKVEVKKPSEFYIKGKVVYKTTGAELSIKDFVKDEGEYTYSYVDEDAVNEIFSSSGGPFSIAIKAQNQNNDETIIYSVLYLTSENPRLTLTCSSSDENDYITDKLSFDSDMNNMNNSLRIKYHKYSSLSEFEKARKTIENGKITFDDEQGVALTSNTDLSIGMVKSLNDETLEKEYGSAFPSSYQEINAYYRQTKKYKCSI